MPSTYTTNNGIELIGTGEQSGTWGETTNTNFGLIDTALDGQLTKTLASAGTSGSPNTLIIEDGTTSDGRNRLVIFNDGSDLGGTAYVQLTPDNAEKIMFVRNSLSGERSIIFFQGTYNASNDFELPNGTDAVIKFDGAGTGAVVEAVFKKLYLQDLLLDTSSAQTMYIESTIPTFNMKETDADLNEKFWRLQTSAGVFKVDAVNDAYDTAATAYSVDRSGVTPNLHIWYSNASEAMRVTSAGNVGIGTSTPATALDVNGTITGTSLDMNGGAVFNESGADVDFRIESDTNTHAFFLQGSDGNVGIKEANPSDALHVAGGIISEGVFPNIRLYETDTTDLNTRLLQDNGSFFIQTVSDAGAGLGTRMTINHASGDVTFNDVGADADFRIESDTNTHAFFLRGSDGNVGIGTSTPNAKLEVKDGNFRVSGNASIIEILDTNAGVDNGLWDIAIDDGPLLVRAKTDAGAGGGGFFRFTRSVNNVQTLQGYRSGTLRTELSGWDTHLLFSNAIGTIGTATAHDLVVDTNNAERMRITSAGNVGIGTSSPSAKLDVNGAAEINDTLLISRAAVAPKITFENSSYAGGDGGIGYFNSGALTFDTNAAERMRIDASGNLSVGTSTALGRFVSERPATAGWALAGKTVGIANEGGLYFDATNNGELVARNASGTVNVSLKSNGDSFLNGGSVGIGTSSPQTNLHVDAGTKNYTGTTPGLTSYAVSIESGSTGTCGIGIGSHNNIPSIQGFGGGTAYNVALCPAAGNVGIGTASPTSKLEVADLSGATGVEVSAYRNGTTYGNSYIKFNGPRSNTTDGNTQDGRGAITLLGNSSSNAGSLWINAASATLVPETANEATMQGYQAGLNLNSDGEFSFWDGGSQRFLINSSGDVGIGTSSPSEKLHISGTGETILVTPVAYSSSQDSPYLIASGTNYNGATTNWGTYGYQHRLKVNASGTPRVTIDTNLGEAYSVNHLSVICPNGVTLGTAAGTYNAANTLDDYEEGTWEPRYAGTTTAGTYTYDIQEGYYIKVGNVVTVTGRLRTDSASGATGNAYIANLPYTCKNTTNAGVSGCGSLGQTGDFDTQYPVGLYAGDNQARLFLTTQPSANSTINLMNAANGFLDAANANGMFFSCTYLTD